MTSGVDDAERWPCDPLPESGIDVRSLELDPTDPVMLDILRRSGVRASLAAWGGGTALGDDTYGRVTASAAVGVISVVGQSLTDYARGGSAIESVQYNFGKLADTEADESQVLVLRCCRATLPSVASRRRGRHRVSSPPG